MSFKHISKSLVAIIFTCLIILSSYAHALEINSVRFGSYPDKIRLVLDTNQTNDFRVFTLSSPYRLVIDMPDFTWKAGQTKLPTTSFISDIRQGKLSNGLARIVFDLNRPVTVQSAFLLPANKTNSSRLVVDYKIVDNASFEKSKSTIHGTLKLEDYNKNTSQREQYSGQPNTPLPPPNIMRPAQNNQTTSIRKPVIILDPGHGGIDPGAIGKNKVYEKTVVLQIARELKKQLLSSGKYNVFLTRNSDRFIKLKNRVKFAREHSGDLFISLHADSIKKKNVRGTSIYTLSKKSSDAQTAALAKKENQADLMGGIDLNIEDQQVAFILGDFLINETMNQSKYLANTVVKTLNNQGLKTLHNPHRYAGFAVLKAPDIPSVLIETGFMSNKQEARLLTQKGHQQKVSKAIRRGIDAYFKHAAMNETN